MARYTGPKCKLCRREGVKLFLRGTRCETAKCAISRRDYPPGMQSMRRGRVSEYGIQLREKQKVKRYYGVLERQFRRIFAEAMRQPGNTGEHLLILLERRLDNAVTRAGLAVSHAQARQFIVHGHVFVNDRRVDRPSYPVKPGDVISIRAKENSQKLTRERLELTKGAQRPAWIAFEEGPLRARIVALPTRDEVTLPVQEQLIVEFCSK